MVSDENLRFRPKNQCLFEDESSTDKMENKDGNRIRERLGNFQKRARSDSNIENKPQSERFNSRNVEKASYGRDQTSFSYPEISTERLVAKHRSKVAEGTECQEMNTLSPFEMVREVWKERERIYKEEKTKSEINNKTDSPITQLELEKSTTLQSIVYEPRWSPQPFTVIVNGLYDTCYCQDNSASTKHTCPEFKPCSSSCCLKCCKTVFSGDQTSSVAKASRSRYKKIPVSSKPSCTCWHNRIGTGFQSPISRVPSFKNIPICYPDTTVSHKIRDAVAEYSQAPSTCISVDEHYIHHDIHPSTSTGIIYHTTKESYCSIDESDYWLYKKTGMIPPGFYLIPKRGWLLPQLCCYREVQSLCDKDKVLVKVYCSPARNYHIRCLHENLCWYKQMCENMLHPKSELDAVFEAMRKQQTLQQSHSCWKLHTDTCKK